MYPHSVIDKIVYSNHELSFPLRYANCLLASTNVFIVPPVN